MSKVACANSNFGCLNSVTQRGTIYCDVCVERKKASQKDRKESIIEDLSEKNRIMDKELIKLRLAYQELQRENLEKEIRYKNSEDIKKLREYNGILENQLAQNLEIMEKLKHDNEVLSKRKIELEVEVEQIKINLSKNILECSKNLEKIKKLEEENNLLEKENIEISKFLEKKEEI